jgi:hypothetical protein
MDGVEPSERYPPRMDRADSSSALTGQHDIQSQRTDPAARGRWHIDCIVKEPDQSKSNRRDAAAIAACVGISTETLEKIATLPVTERPAALAEAAARQAKKFRAGG